MKFTPVASAMLHLGWLTRPAPTVRAWATVSGRTLRKRLLK